MCRRETTIQLKKNKYLVLSKNPPQSHESHKRGTLDLEEKAHPCSANTNVQKTRRKPLGTKALAMRIDPTILANGLRSETSPW